MTTTGRVADSDGENDRRTSSLRFRRAELRARMAAERAELFCSLLGMDVELLEDRPLQGTTSAAGLLSAVAWREDSLVSVMTESREIAHTSANPEARAIQLSAGFDDALAQCINARTRFLDAFARIPDTAVFGEPADSRSALSPLAMATQCHWSDASLSLRASAWSRDYETGASNGPPSLLRAAVRAARKDLLTTVALVPGEARGFALFEGGRTLPRIFRQIADLESSFLGYLASVGFAPPMPETVGVDTNEEAWECNWSNLHDVHSTLMRVLDALHPAAYAATIGSDDNAESVYTWARGCLLHDRLYGAHIRAMLQLDWPERLLR